MNKSLDSLGSNFYKIILGSSGLGTDFNQVGVRVDLSGNDSLRFIGGGFQNENYDLISLTIQNNNRLNNLCVFKPKILSFPDPQSNLPLLYKIYYNAQGANSIKEVISADCSQNSGINNTVQSQHVFNLYPNPNHGNFQLKFPDEDMYDVTVINYLGIKVYHSMASNSNNEIHLTHIPKGNYILKCMNKNYDKTIKLLVE